MSKRLNRGNILIPVILILIFATAAYAQTTEFTYQGKINDANGQAAAYDFEFRLCVYETISCSPPLAVFTKTNVAPSSSGIFTIKVDFGNGQFAFTDRYVEVAVRRTGETNYTTLTPRQEITSAPYAIFSNEAGNAISLGNISASQYVLTTDPRLSATNYVQNGTNAQTGVNFNIGGTGTAGILNAGTQFNLGGERILGGAAGTDNLFAGRNSGAANTGSSNSFFGTNSGRLNVGNNNSFFGAGAGEINNSGVSNSFFGGGAGASNTSGRLNSFFGAGAGGMNAQGDRNTFFGSSAGVLNSTGGNNTFLGYNAGNANSTGSNNTLIGATANVGAENLTFATAVGVGATVSTSNTLVLGRSSDAVQAPGSLNVGSLINVGTQYNLGGTRFFSNGGSNGNTYIGANSQCGTANGSDSISNTFIGNNTALGCTIGSGNTVVGNSAGNVGDGDLNTLIGSSAKIADGSPTIFNSTAIGALARVSKSNTMVLGTPFTNTVIKGNIQVYAGREEPGGPNTSPAFESVTTTTYGSGLAVSRLYLQTIANPVFTQSPICFSASSGGQIPYGIVGYCANGTGLSSLKDEIKTFSGGLAIVKRLNPISFKWKETGESSIGLNVEDVAAVEPQLINRDEKGEIRDVKTESLNIVLLNAVKEQQAQIEDQQKQIEQLKKIVCAINPVADVCKEEEQK